MRRRAFIAGIGSAMAAPLVARAQQPPPVIGWMRTTTSEDSAPLLAAFQRGLAEHGFVDGQNVAFEYRFAQNDISRLPALAAELVLRGVTVILAGGFPSALAAKAATSEIPIVFTGGAAPVRSRLVDSLNQPGGNVTGINFFGGSQLTLKRVELMHALRPDASVFAALLDPNYVESEVEISDIEAAGRAIRRRIAIVKAANESEVEAAFPAMLKASAGALIVGGAPFFTAVRHRLAALCASHGLPAVYLLREFVESGGLMSYGNSQADAYRRAGTYVGRILKGEKPGELPVERSIKFELVINLKTARALNLAIPATLLAIADEVIE